MKKNSTLRELLVGIAGLGILTQIVILVAFEGDLQNAIGLWAGIVLAGGMTVHMSHTIEEAVELGADNAAKYMQRKAVLRLGIVIVILALLLYYKIGNPITLVVGLFALKISAYLQPFIHKLCGYRTHKGEGRNET